MLFYKLNCLSEVDDFGKVVDRSRPVSTLEMCEHNESYYKYWQNGNRSRTKIVIVAKIVVILYISEE